MPKAANPKPRKKAAKQTATVVEARINAVFDMLIKGANRQQIIQYAASANPAAKPPKEDWNVETRQIDTYIARANERFIVESAADRKLEIGKAKARYEAILNAAMKVQDYQRALAAERARCELLGLNAPKELRILEGVNERQLAELVEALNRSGITPSEIFNSLIKQLAEADAKPS
jgi:hypothetical protein